MIDRRLHLFIEANFVLKAQLLPLKIQLTLLKAQLSLLKLPLPLVKNRLFIAQRGISPPSS